MQKALSLNNNLQKKREKNIFVICSVNVVGFGSIFIPIGGVDRHDTNYRLLLTGEKLQLSEKLQNVLVRFLEIGFFSSTDFYVFFISGGQHAIDILSNNQCNS